MAGTTSSLASLPFVFKSALPSPRTLISTLRGWITIARIAPSFRQIAGESGILLEP